MSDISDTTNIAAPNLLNAESKPKKTRKTPFRKPKWSISDFVVEVRDDKKRFHDFNLHENIMRGLQRLDFPYCTPIQEQILAHTLQGFDAIGKAQTGTGKTAAFLISILQKLLTNPAPQIRYIGEPRALIIAPTRELAVQIAKDAEQLAKFTKLKIISLIGGSNSIKPQQRALENHYCDILIATPGRLLDFCQQELVHLDLVEILVLDEADRMLDMGFIPQVTQIIEQTPSTKSRQTLLFSATFSVDVLELAYKWLYKPVTVEIKSDSLTSDNVTQQVYTVTKNDKPKLLHNLLKQNDWQKIIIFANRKQEVNNITELLIKNGFDAKQMSGDIPQEKRTKVLNKFSIGKLQILVATDVVGRGIHINDVDCVINYNLPEKPSDYVHRIGRTGRAGSFGVSISFADENCIFSLMAIEDLLGAKIKCEVPPAELL